MTWVNVVGIRRNYKGPGPVITAGIAVATGGAPRLMFNFNKAAVHVMKLQPERVDMEVGQGSDEGFVRINFGRQSGGLRIINASGHSAAGLRLSTSLWEGVTETKCREFVKQAFWDPEKRCLVMALPDIILGKQTRHRNDLGAELGLS